MLVLQFLGEAERQAVQPPPKNPLDAVEALDMRGAYRAGLPFAYVPPSLATDAESGDWGSQPRGGSGLDPLRQHRRPGVARRASGRLGGLSAPAPAIYGTTMKLSDFRGSAKHLSARASLTKL